MKKGLKDDMNSLEWINEQIKECDEMIERLNIRKDEYSKNKSLVKTYNKHIKNLTGLKQRFEQIKFELEAWEVCKKHYHINKYEDINKGRDKKRFDITIWLNTENCDFKSCASYEECLKVKNALEVEDES